MHSGEFGITTEGDGYPNYLFHRRAMAELQTMAHSCLSALVLYYVSTIMYLLSSSTSLYLCVYMCPSSLVELSLTLNCSTVKEVLENSKFSFMPGEHSFIHLSN